jgi:predicted metalloprotease with PDZ domain
MKNKLFTMGFSGKSLTLCLLCFVSITHAAVCTGEKIVFTVSMENPTKHCFHVNLQYVSDNEKYTDFVLPVWAPGYYFIQDFSKNIFNFKATDEKGQALKWHKISKNIWRIEKSNTNKIILDYDIFAFKHSIIECYLDDERAFISPVGMFMHVKDKINGPVVIHINKGDIFSTISTGLENLGANKSSFIAPDFDLLYDCPIMIGNHKEIEFELKGLKHYFAIDYHADYDYEKMITDLKKMIETATNMIGEIPYQKYYFLCTGAGRGGLEHRNSMVVSTGLPNMESRSAYLKWLSFITHEYFHLYNVKTIRPIVLGPFDYSNENYTNMLWVSEGFTVYYEYIILKRAGLITEQEFFEFITENIKNYEDIPASLMQSATQASFDTWTNFFNFNENSVNTKISYYDKGCSLGLLLDLQIRMCTKNAKALDDVMSDLYFTWHKQKNRGFTDLEFRDACEKMAGCKLDEIFEKYAETTAPVDYSKYLDYAGLQIDTAHRTAKGSFIGAQTRNEADKIFISQILWNSPAWHSELSVRDEILQVNHSKAGNHTLDSIMNITIPGEEIYLLVLRNGKEKNIKIRTERKTERSFRINRKDKPNKLQKLILDDWLG